MHSADGPAALRRAIGPKRRHSLGGTNPWRGSENDIKMSARNLSCSVFNFLSSFGSLIPVILSRAKMAKNNRKVIISCAITGSVHTPTMSEYLPVTPSQIVDSAVEAAEAGAAILHIHARNGKDGRPSGDPARYREICPALAERTSSIINITTGGSSDMTIEQRLAYPSRPNPRCVR